MQQVFLVEPQAGLGTSCLPAPFAGMTETCFKHMCPLRAVETREGGSVFASFSLSYSHGEQPTWVHNTGPNSWSTNFKLDMLWRIILAANSCTRRGRLFENLGARPRANFWIKKHGRRGALKVLKHHKLVFVSRYVGKSFLRFIH